MATIAAIWDSLSQRFELFFINKSPRCFLSSFESTGLSVQKKKGKIDFQDGRHLGFLTSTILAIFISTSHPNPSYQFSNQLALWPPRWPSWISDPNNLSYFRSTSHPNASYQVSNQMAFQLRRRSKNRYSRWLSWRPSWISDRDDFSYFWSTGHPDASYLV